MKSSTSCPSGGDKTTPQGSGHSKTTPQGSGGSKTTPQGSEGGEPIPLGGSGGGKTSPQGSKHFTLLSPRYTPHKHSQMSLLSAKAKNTDFRGFFNLACLLVLTTNLGMVVENFIKYGILVRNFWDIFGEGWATSVVIALTEMSIIPLLSFVIERYADFLPNILIRLLAISCVIGEFTVPWGVLMFFSPGYWISMILLSFSIVWSMKLISFHHTCSEIRFAIRESTLEKALEEACAAEKEIVLKFPKCISLFGLYRFMWTPTLCFQFYYPSNPRIRPMMIVRHCVFILIIIALSHIVVDQYVTPTVMNTIDPIVMGEIPAKHIPVFLLQRTLKLAVPIVYIWLLSFLGVFHHWLNLLAEITRFADRSFYDDWWNATSLGEYWHKWNSPIRNFMVRHVFRPMIHAGFSTSVAQVVVFVISAAMHEYIVNKIYIFQPPRGHTDHNVSSNWANILDISCFFRLKR
eukprot:GHVL01031192.1.p1 GENE.GHVL01031192.1~~GHVL01031192.1.p1  ORF type:complete len:462 (-),score=60.50 GHVL01031192.1:80-1465(-)